MAAFVPCHCSDIRRQETRVTYPDILVKEHFAPYGHRSLIRTLMHTDFGPSRSTGRHVNVTNNNRVISVGWRRIRGDRDVVGHVRIVRLTVPTLKTVDYRLLLGRGKT